jgi:hypothetical protein
VYNLALDQLNITTTEEVERARECYTRLTSSVVTPSSMEEAVLNCEQFEEYLSPPLNNVDTSSAVEIKSFTDIHNVTVSLKVTVAEKHSTLMKLIELYTEVTTLNAAQSKPLWPALMEFPTMIDKNAMLDEELGDEYVYWAN